MGDPAALSLTLMNLSLNAVDAMPDGGTLSFHTSNDPEGFVTLSISDTGIGMSKEVLAKALDPFFTTKPPGKGTGLGLSIAYRTVSAHQGTIRLESEPGHGTTIIVRIPSARPSFSQPTENPSPTGKAARKSLEVYLIDDEELLLSTIPLLLKALGHQATISGDGQQAIERLKSGYTPDLIILDMNMPGMDGKETLAQIRLLHPTLPVLLATGRIDETVLTLVADNENVALLPKPFQLKDLAKAIENWSW